MNAEQEIRAKLGDFAADQDLMRDVYMTDSQRAAYQRILSRALEQPASAAGVEGMVLVPREVTPEMVLAFQSGEPGDKSFWGCYRAMLAAAPQPATKESRDE